MKKTVLPLAAIVALLVGGPGVRAQGAKDEPARLQYRQGIELFEAGRFEQAAVAFRKAYELRPAYKVLFNLAQAENNADRFAAALQAYTRYLADGGDEIPERRADQVQAEIRRLNALVGTIEIRDGPDGAEVLVDKEVRGRTPLDGPLFLDLGRHEVAVEHGGKRIFERMVTLAGGEKAMLEIVPASGADTAGDEGASTGSTSSTGSTDSAPRPWTWVTLGVGGAAAVAAAITGGVVLSRAGDIKDRCVGDECPPSVESDLDGARTLGTATDVLWGVAAAGIAAGVVLFFIEPGFGGQAPEATVGFAPLSGGGAVSVGGRF